MSGVVYVGNGFFIMPLLEQIQYARGDRWPKFSSKIGLGIGVGIIYPSAEQFEHDAKHVKASGVIK